MDSSPTHTNKLNSTSSVSTTVTNKPITAITKQRNKDMPLLDYNNGYLQKILQFGKELFQMNAQFTQESGENQTNTKMLKVNSKYKNLNY
jgi:hypothetical protein